MKSYSAADYAEMSNDKLLQVAQHDDSLPQKTRQELYAECVKRGLEGKYLRVSAWVIKLSKEGRHAEVYAETGHALYADPYYKERFATAQTWVEKDELVDQFDFRHQGLRSPWYESIKHMIPRVHELADRERQPAQIGKTETTQTASRRKGKRRDPAIVKRDNVIATLKESYKNQKGRRNRKIAQSLDEQSYYPPEDWDVRTFSEALQNEKTRAAFHRIVSRAKFKKLI